MEIRRKGTTGHKFYPAVMFSHARLTYTAVAQMIDEPEGETAERYKDLVPQIGNLYRLFKLLVKSRQLRGAIDFETIETQIIFDDKGKIERIVRSGATRSSRDRGVHAAANCVRPLPRKEAPILIASLRSAHGSSLRCASSEGFGLSPPAAHSDATDYEAPRARQRRPEPGSRRQLRSYSRLYTPRQRRHFASRTNRTPTSRRDTRFPTCCPLRDQGGGQSSALQPWTGTRWARIALPPSVAPTRRRGTSSTGSSATTCATRSARASWAASAG